jgi:hypothetical protein
MSKRLPALTPEGILRNARRRARQQKILQTASPTQPVKEHAKLVETSFDVFRKQFPQSLRNQRVLGSRRLILRILKDETLRNECAYLVWLCVDNSRTHPTEVSKKWCAYWNSEFEAAIRGAKAVANIYTELVSNPRCVKSMDKLRDALLERRRKLMRLPSKMLGRDRDWTPVLYAKNKLESLLGEPLPDLTLAALLNAAYATCGQKQQEFKANAVRMALIRLRGRLL